MNNTITISPTASQTEGGISKMGLLQSKDPEVQKIYRRVFNAVEGSFTTVADNDIIQKLNNAIATLQPNKLQSDFLCQFSEALKEVEQRMEPSRLEFFTITNAMDDEICLNRTSENGLAKIIINDDGLVVLTFIAFKGIPKPDQFIPYTKGVEDYENLAYTFFSY